MDEYIKKGALFNLIWLRERLRKQDVLEIIDEFPSADVAEIVRCKDCIHSSPIDTKDQRFRYFKPECVICSCEVVIGDEPMVYLPDHFCSYGERKSDNE